MPFVTVMSPVEAKTLFVSVITADSAPVRGPNTIEIGPSTRGPKNPAGSHKVFWIGTISSVAGVADVSSPCVPCARLNHCVVPFRSHVPLFDEKRMSPFILFSPATWTILKILSQPVPNTFVAFPYAP